MSSASTATAPETATEQVLLLELAGRVYAVASAVVREIVPTLPATRLPGAPPHVLGIMNLRGLLVTVVDPGPQLTGRPTRNLEGSTIVVQSGERLLGLRVDEVRDVQALELTAAKGLPYESVGRGLVRGLGRLGDEVVIVLDVDRIVHETLA